MGTRRSNAEHAYVVAYDIADPKRWRQVFKTMKGYGQWVQLSVFQCRLDGGRRIAMASILESLIDRETDHVLMLDLGPAEDVDLAVESLGKAFETLERQAMII
ncbi:CRISPR-associated endonuclease Cas2 [Rhodospirillum rubrum]|uniref:CRISPR-associated endoribonuclease Cas2 1 n=1 Tax=Rhodospirillum rubrum (strain ATCC 11170 / ATH 1.1.1 / DSM 467 / LMG 4362 / NCIMB 8255 / S1) TaxID=269796 RepID=CAS2A_RHORT|nr:CRISPR-associated endonuclease Cas2 [Rhodospirillum rubrum]Q2RY12.1 RecName: Full=CRISPR-associated endoribonuclease Cas2 1 [Rhodospirillum rubrum ATCC 11170]ABC20983.1 CRISPR-associated protein, Cas2 family [Rhodospirillum rubrum ATCC 11170]AEO46648.1 CRISPR-associated Cas2 family protein [Rhodospirillum rubrum F11]MBK5952539.1 CRISPR-associated endonuclease Cas2 [Rhodospirillum rubrum]QXG80681.1 CRISPR-associated endonuclease Cas2 [Rhodospirillum rubrum]HAQ00168.1 CRISPR-associated endon